MKIPFKNQGGPELKIFIKFLFSLLALPFLLPWFLADKFFEVLIQPVIFKKYSLEISRRKIWALRIVKILVPILLIFYIVKKIFYFFSLSQSFATGIKNLKILFMLFYNDFAVTANFFFRPINHLIYYLSGGYIRFWDFIYSLYFNLVIVLFIINLIYRLIKTFRSIDQAVMLRNRAVREVDIVHFAQSAKDDEIFLGLDVNRGGKPFYAKRSWLKGHVQVVGGPGTGKTESIVQPIWFQEVRRNVATFVLDGKASRRNVDSFFTIASSLAQAQDVFYFNPADPTRSATYNPLLRGTIGDVKRKIINSINWAEHSHQTREHLDTTLDIILRAMVETNSYFNLRELSAYFHNRSYLGRLSERVNDNYVRNSLREILMDFSAFQTSMSFFSSILNELSQSGYGQLINTNKPKIDIIDVYRRHKDCYFTLPMQADESASRFLGQLILQDIQYCFHQIAMSSSNSGVDEGLLIIDEMAKFISPHFIELLQTSRNVGVSVCYTNQSLVELHNPALNLSKSFIDQLTDHTNITCCFQLRSPESIQIMLDRIGRTEPTEKDGEGSKKELNLTDPNLLKHLDVGRCITFIHRPRVLTILKTGYFKFDKLLRFGGQGEDTMEQKKTQ